MVFIILQISGRGQFGRVGFFFCFFLLEGGGLAAPSCPCIYSFHFQKRKTILTTYKISILTYKVKYFSNLALPPREIAPFIAGFLMDGEHRAPN